MMLAEVFRLSLGEEANSLLLWLLVERALGMLLAVGLVGHCLLAELPIE